MHKTKPHYLRLLVSAALALGLLLLFSAGIGFSLIQSFGLMNPVPIQGDVFQFFIRLFNDSWFLLLNRRNIGNLLKILTFVDIVLDWHGYCCSRGYLTAKTKRRLDMQTLLRHTQTHNLFNR